MKRKVLFVFMAALLPLWVVAQINPQLNYSTMDDYMLRKKVKENPSLMQQYVNYEKAIKQRIDAQISQIKTDTLYGGRHVIPVVFHVVHKYGFENISNAQIEDAIQRLTIDYNKQNADTSVTFPLFQPRAANCRIEFRLAKIDPDGNCTTGIDRIYDPQTNFAYFSTMSEYAWPPSKYLNIYAVNFIYPDGVNLPDGAFIGGMSPFPPSNALGAAITGGDTLVDGVLIRHDCIGSIGTATNLGGSGMNYLNRTLTHEMGHYLNLYHPFQNLTLWLGTIPVLGADGCATNGSGLFSFVSLNNDEVDDTPPIITASQPTGTGCFTPGSRNTCTNDVPDEPDMVENYMDYNHGFCINLFTAGQLTRINDILNNDRRGLWSLENLHNTGVWDTTIHYNCGPIADFNTVVKNVCPGNNVQFTDFSYNGAATSWEWTFTGATPSSSTLQNPIVVYNTAGTYAVKLKVSNAYGSDSLTQTSYIKVRDTSATIIPAYAEGFESTTLANFVVNNENGNTWEISDSASYSGTKCIRVANFGGNKSGSTDEIILPPFDLTTSISGIYKLYFKLSYAARKIPNNAIAELLTGQSTGDTIYDRLEGYVSTDCGATWSLKFAKSGFQLTTAPMDSVSFFPTSTAMWREEMVNLASSTNQPYVLVKFLFFNRGGNNVYIDDINIESLAAIDEEVLQNLNFNIWPNPSDGNSTLSFDLIAMQKVKIELFDMLGRNLKTFVNKDLGQGSYKYDLHSSDTGTPGIYLIKLTVGNNIITKRIVVN
ncbi:MAG: T9SS type A sorting domain-containing protein [Bacteroidota bacterium]